MRKNRVLPEVAASADAHLITLSDLYLDVMVAVPLAQVPRPASWQCASVGRSAGVDHPGPGAGSTGPPRRRGVVQTESARNRLKRTLRGSDRRSAEVGSGVDQWTTPWRIFLAGGWTGPRRLAEGRRPTTPQRGRCGGCVWR